MTVMLERRSSTEEPRKRIRPWSGSASFQELCRTLLEMKVPDGYRTEIIGGNIVMSPFQRGYYHFAMEHLEEQLRPHLPKGHTVGSRPFLFAFPEQDRVYGPDTYVVDREVFRTADRLLDGASLALVAELTSPSTAGTDWGDKLRVYGHAGVPVHLVLHAADATATVFWQPTPEGYAERSTVPYGEKLHIPAPFDFELDTAEFGELPEAAPESG
ncbi:Uma2 family endonuclease [Streptomyces xiaopingdaonensis]|uniref:Uma2 family endonuclease n=1 Tax=Streptomyces xiaopingdaonensis TaxID=1565415 RepID=UPI0004947F49|nr:Uma2 family endonuclease [Streptomyces xiaopingdaonensis]